MTIAGMVMFLIIILRLLRHKDYDENRFYLFILTVIVSIFINIGYVFSFFKSYTYSEILMVITVFYSIFGTKKITQKELFAIGFLLLSVIVALANISINSSDAYIIPMSIDIDDVTYGLKGAQHPKIGSGNISSLLNLCVFILFIVLNKDFFKNNKYSERIKQILDISFRYFFIIIILELIISNLTSGVAARSIINRIFGVVYEDKTYMRAPLRYGIYCAYGFFSEPSYCTKIIIYAFLLYIKESFTKLDMFFSILAVITLGVTGSASCYMLIPLIVCIAIYRGIYYRYGIIGKIIIISLCAVFVYLSLKFISNIDISNSAKDSFVVKILSYINGKETMNSGYTRSMGNARCYEVLKYNPLFGVGIGTTRGYSFNAGVIANFGILGIAALLFFYKTLCNLKLKSNILKLVIVVMYFMAIWTVWDAYSPAIIGILICFNKNNIKKVNEEDFIKV